MPEQGIFKGVSELTFESNPDFSDDLYISAHSLTISQILVNDRPIDNDYFSEIANSQPGFIRLASQHLAKDKFKITIKYTGHFASLFGLVSYLDPASAHHDQYIFASASQIGTSAIFPVIEAPNIKGMFRLAVAAPKTWKVYSNEKSDDAVPLNDSFAEFGRGTEVEPEHSKFHVFKFRQTKSIPFNGLNIVAGKIHEIKTK